MSESNYTITQHFIPGPAFRAMLFFLRAAVGWHLLYEGLGKMFTPHWSSVSYLKESYWIFGSIFRWLASSPSRLAVVDFLNEWGLTLLGLALLVGCFTRTAAMLGAVLLGLYYLAQPPLIGFESSLAEGSYLLVNKNLIEILVLGLFVLVPSGSLWGIDRLLRRLRAAIKGTGVAQGAPQLALDESHPVRLSPRSLLERRELVKSLAALPLLGVFVLQVLKKRSYEEEQLKRFRGVDAVTSPTRKILRFADLKDLKGQVPKGYIGNQELSRLICGGNLVAGFAHARDLIYVSPLLKTYFTDDKVIETLRLCEASGIDTAILRTDENTIRILDKYWKRGGTIKWLAQVYPKQGDLTGNAQKAIDHGAIGALVQGGIADKFIMDNHWDWLEKAVAHIKRNRVLAGVAAHSLQVPIICERNGLDLDFYMKTLHNDDYWSAHPRENRPEFSIIGEAQRDHNQYHDNMWCLDPGETVAFMATVKKPWIAYKILAAGAIPPKDGFRYAFENGADFACVGMFDFQVVENANIAVEVLSPTLKRSRAWFA
ncbi:MAG: hypothetical protein ACE15E_03220 [Acidobacteriota bacterium]